MKNINKKVCHAESLLLSIFCLLGSCRLNNLKKGGPELQPFRTTTLFNAKAFTLIELLVVVLIIGILAAVAVPQYEKAVWHGRYAQLVTLTNSLALAAEEYYLANGVRPNDFGPLSIQMNCQSPFSGRIKCDDYYCDFRANNTLSCMNEKSLQNGYAVNVNFSTPSAKTKYCIALTENTSDKYHNFCKSQTHKTDHASAYDILTSVGVYKRSYWYSY